MELDGHYKRVSQTKGEEKFTSIVVGNKRDLDRIVNLKEAKDFALKIKANYVDISAKEKKEVDQLFQTILEQYMIEHNLVEVKNKKKSSGLFESLPESIQDIDLK